jgi:hypothetical protein
MRAQQLDLAILLALTAISMASALSVAAKVALKFHDKVWTKCCCKRVSPEEFDDQEPLLLQAE